MSSRTLHRVQGSSESWADILRHPGLWLVEARPIVSPLAHAGSYYALASDGVDLGNYEAATGHFQLAWKRPQRLNGQQLEKNPGLVDPELLDPMPDYLVVWSPEHAGSALDRWAVRYRPLASKGRALLLRRAD